MFMEMQLNIIELTATSVARATAWNRFHTSRAANPRLSTPGSDMLYRFMKRFDPKTFVEHLLRLWQTAEVLPYEAPDASSESEDGAPMASSSRLHRKVLRLERRIL